MDYHYFKQKLNDFYHPYVGKNKRPTFFEINQICAQLNDLTANFATIKQEFETILVNVPHLPRYHDIDPGETEISATSDKKWSVFMIYLLGYQTQEAKFLCPELCALLKTIPNLIQAFFSILEPGKSIPLHDGPYLGYLRYHLGISIPKHNPPSIVVNKQPYTWQEGEAILFDDSWPHEVINTSDEYRAVLIVDILRPMPFLPHILNRFVTEIIAKYFYGRPVMKKVNKYKKNAVPLHQ